MAELHDFDKARERRIHERKEAKVRGIRDAFRAARESWESDDTRAGKLKGLFNKKKKKGRRK